MGSLGAHDHPGRLEAIRAAVIPINLALNLLPQGQKPRDYRSDQALTIIGDLPTQVPPHQRILRKPMDEVRSSDPQPNNDKESRAGHGSYLLKTMNNGIAHNPHGSVRHEGLENVAQATTLRSIAITGLMAHRQVLCESQYRD